MGKIITPTLPHDLPENWNENQYVSPGGTEVGLTEQHGYNYLMKQVNNAQRAINELDDKTLDSKGYFNAMASEPASLEKTGWYRLATFEGDVNTCVNALLFMGHTFHNGGASSLLASINFYSYAPSIVVLDHKFTNYLFFEKLRIVKNENRQIVYLDFYYGRDFENIVSAGLFTFSYRESPDEPWTQTMHNLIHIIALDPDDSVVLVQDLASVANGSVLTTGSAVVPATLE